MASNIVKRWSESTLTFSEVIELSAEASLPISKVCLDLLAIKGNYQTSKAREKAQHIFDNEQDYEESLFHFFLCIWAYTALTEYNSSEAEALIAKSSKLKNVTPELKFLSLNLLGRIQGTKGNSQAREKLLDASLKMLPKTSARYEHSLLGIIHFSSFEGRLIELKKQIKQMTEFNFSVKLLLINNYLQTYQLDKAKEMINGLDLKNTSIKRSMDRLCLLEVYEALTSQADRKETPSNLNSKKLTLIDKWHVSTYFLLNKNTSAALEWSKKFTTSDNMDAHIVSLYSFSLIRAELSSRNHIAASKQMSDKTLLGNAHYLDDFFNGRIQLLKGNKKEAMRLFKSVYGYCLYYEALPRLFYEIELSVELSKNEVVKLIQDNLQTKPKTFKSFQISDQNYNQNDNALIGKSNSAAILNKIIVKYKDANATILILGETGVGKEVVANTLHQSSSRSSMPFLAINCSAISKSLLYSELFGYQKGSYTGANKDHQGVFEAAGKGTVFLDEIGEVSEQVQVTLLRVLESYEIRPTGSTKGKKIHCRIIAATNKNLKEKVRQGTFREDLYYRLNRLEINLAPLRERDQDIILLAKHFLKSKREDQNQPDLSMELQRAMLKYPWPGNVRQLKNEMDRLRLIHSEKLYYEIDDFDLISRENEKINQTIATNSKQIETNDKVETKTAPNSSTKIELTQIIFNEKSPLRRRNKIKELFNLSNELTRGEIARTLKVTPATIASDLKLLGAEGYIKKITPSASTRTHYYQLIKKP